MFVFELSVRKELSGTFVCVFKVHNAFCRSDCVSWKFFYKYLIRIFHIWGTMFCSIKYVFQKSPYLLFLVGVFVLYFSTKIKVEMVIMSALLTNNMQGWLFLIFTILKLWISKNYMLCIECLLLVTSITSQEIIYIFST